MTTAAPGSVACLLCGGRALTPVLHPPLVRCRGCGLVFRDIPDGGRQVARAFAVTNSRPSDGDPYGTLPRRTEAAARAVKGGIHLVVRAIAAGSHGRLLLGSSLAAAALKGGAA